MKLVIIVSLLSTLFTGCAALQTKAQAERQEWQNQVIERALQNHNFLDRK